MKNLAQKLKKYSKTHKKVIVFVIALLGFFGFILIVSAVLVGSSVDKFEAFWQTQNKANPNGDYTVVALGDSTVQGIGATSPYKGFVGQAVRRYEKQHNKTISLYNYSKTGAKVSDVLNDQFPMAQHVDTADLVIIAVGPNDATNGTPLDDYIASYQEVLDKLPKEKTVIANIPPLGRRGMSNETIEEWNVRLETLTAINQITMAPVYQVIKPRSYNPLIYSGDFYHPSNIGYGLWADAFYPHIETVLLSQPL